MKTIIYISNPINRFYDINHEKSFIYGYYTYTIDDTDRFVK